MAKSPARIMGFQTTVGSSVGGASGVPGDLPESRAPSSTRSGLGSSSSGEARRGLRRVVTPAIVGSLLLLTASLAGGRLVAQEDCTVSPSTDWKNRVDFLTDPFRHVGELAEVSPGWVKFSILLCDPERVVYQQSTRYPFHYDFATERLDPFLGVSRQDFDARSLHEKGQEIVLGAVIFPELADGAEPQEYGIQLSRVDAYSAVETLRYLELVRDSVEAPPGVQPFYFPTHDQRTAAEDAATLLRDRGFELGSPARWADDDIVYSEGWAIGRIVEVPSDLIRLAYIEGTLRPEDILLTDSVPEFVPFVAGMISLRPSTPNSHVAILAKNFGVPFVHLVDPAKVELARELEGRRVVLRAAESHGSNVLLSLIEGRVDEETMDELIALKELPPLDIAATEARGAFHVPTEGLGPSDIRFVGGKAANFGVLREALPDHSPVALAFTFDLWQAFLDQEIDLEGEPGPRTLRSFIESELDPHRVFPPANVEGLVVTLGQIRELIRDPERTVFSDPLRTAVIDALSDPRFQLDPRKRIRFRSSTNMEDSDHFTGAGLFSSASGCLEDDLDDDVDGPSACDPTKPQERGVFRALRIVFASFYNENAFLERIRWGIDETAVGMAVLAHPSFPDPIELANGVAVAEKRGSGWLLDIVSQPGAVSVANPTDGSTPEEVEVSVFSFGSFATLLEPSSHLVLGDTVLDWQDEYVELAGLLIRAAEEFERQVGETGFRFDFEFKKVAPDGDLVVKQIRRLPPPDDEPLVPFLLGTPVELCTFQGEYGTVFGNHRLKSNWSLSTRSTWLSPEELALGVFDRVAFDYTDGCDVRTFEGSVASLPDATTRSSDGVASLEWRFRDLPNWRSYRLDVDGLPESMPASRGPIVTIADARAVYLSAEYASDVYDLGFDGERTRVSTDHARLSMETGEIAIEADRLCGPTAGELLQSRQMSGPGGLEIETTFYWPPPPRGIVAGYTAPLLRWVETVISGWTSEPIVLRGDFSQTYRPEHHNFGEHFVFDPWLEPGVPAALLDELAAKGVRLIHGRVGLGGEEATEIADAELGHRCDCTPEPRGDANADDQFDVSDAIYVLRFLFSGGPPPPKGTDVADVNADERVDLADPIYFLQFLFQGGEPLPVTCVP